MSEQPPENRERAGAAELAPEPPRVQRGSVVLRELLETRLFDLRALDAAEFPAWLARHLARWERDPVFAQRARVRDLRRAHPELREAEEAQHRARAEDRASALHARLEAAHHELTGADKAVAGLTHALRTAGEEAERERLRRKRERYGQRAERLRAEARALAEASAERLALERVSERLRRLRAELGLDREEAHLRELQRSKGRSTGRSGRAFEDAALAAVRREVLPELDVASGAAPVVLQGVTLGAARTEIDQLVIRPAAHPTAPAEVLALVEAKRNANDLAHGLHRRLENLAWLSGREAGYDPEQYRTAGFPTGHFEGVAVHSAGGRHHRFTRESFRHFLPASDAGALPARLYLVTRPGPLWGAGSATLARIAHRVSSDEAWNPGDPDYLAGLLRWCQELTEPVEAPDLLRRYAADAEASRRVLLLDG